MIFTDTEQAVLDEAHKILQTKMVRSDCFTDVDSTKLYLQTKLANHTTEKFGILFVDSQHQLVEDKIFFNGTVNACGVYPRVIVEQALRLGVSACIAYHNHPSFNSEPSNADINLTKALQSALGLFDIPLLDHFIVGRTVCSFAQRGLL